MLDVRSACILRASASKQHLASHIRTHACVVMLSLLTTVGTGCLAHRCACTCAVVHSGGDLGEAGVIGRVVGAGWRPLRRLPPPRARLSCDPPHCLMPQVWVLSAVFFVCFEPCLATTPSSDTAGKWSHGKGVGVRRLWMHARVASHRKAAWS